MADQEYLTRAEYEARHAGIETRLNAIETKLDTKIDALNRNHDGIRIEMDAKFDKLLAKIDGIKDDIYQGRNQNLRYAVSVIVSFLLGVGIPIALQATHVLR